KLGMDQDIAVERDTGHAASPPYLSPSVIAPTRYPVARFDRRLFSSAANAERHCGSVAGSGGCGEMRATGVPFLVMMIVSPCSAAAISCEKFWLASRTDISRMAPSCSTLQQRHIRAVFQAVTCVIAIEQEAPESVQV